MAINHIKIDKYDFGWMQLLREYWRDLKELEFLGKFLRSSWHLEVRSTPSLWLVKRLHLIISAHSTTSRAAVLAASADELPILDPSWIFDCQRLNKRLNESGKYASPEVIARITARQRRHHHRYLRLRSLSTWRIKVIVELDLLEATQQRRGQSSR